MAEVAEKEGRKEKIRFLEQCFPYPILTQGLIFFMLPLVTECLILNFFDIYNPLFRG